MGAPTEQGHGHWVPSGAPVDPNLRPLHDLIARTLHVCRGGKDDDEIPPRSFVNEWAAVVARDLVASGWLKVPGDSEPPAAGP